jgi:DNA transformation protein
MPVSASFKAFLLDQLRPIHAAIRARSMFGGLGIYAGDLFFAVVAEDRVYLKVNEHTRPEFEAIGMQPFRPFGETGVTMSYYEIPIEILERVERLRPWVEAAIEVAQASQATKKTTRNTSRKASSKKTSVNAVRKKSRRKKNG